MASLSDQARDLIRDEQFQGLPPERKTAVFRAFASEADPEFSKLDEGGQFRAAASIINEHSPGFLDTLKSAGGKAAEIAGGLPFIKPLKQGTRALATGAGPEAVEQRPFTKGILRAIAATGRSVSGIIAPLPGAPGPEQISKSFEEGISQSVVGRMVTEAARDVAEMAGLWKMAGAVVSRIPGLSQAPELAARALGVGTAGEATAVATQAGKRAVAEKILQRVGADITVGELFGVSDAVERQELRPLEQFVLNPLAMAALGLGVMGGSAALRRFGSRRVTEAGQAMEQLSQSDPDFMPMIRDAQQVADRVKQWGRLSSDEAGEAVYYAAVGKASPEQARLVRDILIRDPSLMKNQFGLLLTRQLRPTLSTTVSLSDGPTRLTFEDLKTRQETTLTVRSREEALDLKKRADAGEIYVINARGRAEDISLFEPSLPMKPEVMDGTESLPREPKTVLPATVPVREEAVGISRAERSMGGELSPIERIEQEQMSLADRRVQEAADAATEGFFERVKGLTPREPLMRRPIEPEVPLGKPGKARTGATPAPSQLQVALARASKAEAIPEPGTRTSVSGTALTAEVLGADPRGLPVRLPNGEVVIAGRRAEGVAVPDILFKPPQPAPGTQLDREIQRAVQDTIKDKPLVLESARTFPDPEAGTVTVVDPITREASTVPAKTAAQLVSEGNLAAGEASKLSTSELLDRLDRLRNYEYGNPKYAGQTEEFYRSLAELLSRQGRDEITLDASSRLGALLRGTFQGEGGAVQLGNPSGRPALLKNDPLSAQARVLGGKVFEEPDGRITVEFKFGQRVLSATYGSRSEADAGLRSMQLARLESARLSIAGERAARTGKLPQASIPIDPAEIAPTMRIVETLRPALSSSVDRYTTGRTALRWDEVLPVIVRLNRMGSAGKDLGVVLTRAKEIQDRLNGRYLVEIERLRETVPEAEARSGVRAIERGEGSPQLVAAWERLDTLARENINARLSAGLDDEAPMIAQRRVPHIFDIAQLRDRRIIQDMIRETIEKGLARNEEDALMVLSNQGVGSSRDYLVRRMVDSAEGRGFTMTRAEAESVLDRYVARNAERISGNLERERLGVDGYIDDIFRAYTVYFSRNARRLSEASMFGPKDEIVNRLLDRIEAEAGYASRQYAQKVFDAFIGRTRTEISGFWRGMYNWQTAKLSLSVLANAIQSWNTAMRTGLWNTARSIIEAVGDVGAHPVEAMKGRSRLSTHAKEVGAVATDILSDIRANGISGLEEAAQPLPLKIIGKAASAVELSSTVLFNAVEVGINRTVAVRSGERYFSQQVERLLTNPSDSKAIARLRELGFSKDSILGASKDDLTEMMYLAGQRISNQTQFKADVLSMPLWAQSVLGRFTFQFKNFAFGQARFMWNEITGSHGDTARRLRALGILLTAFPATGIALAKARSAIMGPTSSTEIVDRALSDPTTLNILAAAGAGLAIAGALGIVSDVALTLATASEFSSRAVFLPPAASTVVNAMTVSRSVVEGIANNDPIAYQRAARTFGRELGGVGAGIVQQTLGEPMHGGGSEKPFSGSHELAPGLAPHRFGGAGFGH